MNLIGTMDNGNYNVVPYYVLQLIVKPFACTCNMLRISWTDQGLCLTNHACATV